MGTGDKMLGGNLQWTCIPSRGSSDTPSHFMLQKPTTVKRQSDKPLGLYTDLYNYGFIFVVVELLAWFASRVVTRFLLVSEEQENRVLPGTSTSKFSLQIPYIVKQIGDGNIEYHHPNNYHQWCEKKRNSRTI